MLLTLNYGYYTGNIYIVGSVFYRHALGEIQKPRWEIYFPSEEFLEKWKEKAKMAGVPLSKWIFEIVEAHMDEDTITAQELASDQETLRDQNRILRRELENAKAELGRQKTEAFKLKNEVLLRRCHRV